MKWLYHKVKKYPRDAQTCFGVMQFIESERRVTSVNLYVDLMPILNWDILTTGLLPTMLAICLTSVQAAVYLYA